MPGWAGRGAWPAMAKLSGAAAMRMPAGSGGLTVNGLPEPARAAVGGSVVYNSLSVPKINLFGLPA